MNKKSIFPIITILILIIAAAFYFQTKVSKPNTLPQEETPSQKEDTNNTDNSNSENSEEPSANLDIKQEIAAQLSQKYNRPASDFILEVLANTGSFAKGSLNLKDEHSGGLWFAAKTGNGWELAFDGNGIVTCDIANKYNFPSEIMPGCIDTQNDNQVVQR